MADRVLIADGHNNQAGYAAFAVDPWVPAITPGIRRLSVSGLISEDGHKSAELRWMPKVPNSVVADARTKAGLTGGAIMNEVTVYLPTNEDRTTWEDFNATAYAPEEDEYERGGWQPFLIRLLFLEVAP